MTVLVPLLHGTVPTPLLIEQVVALVIPLQVKVDDWPAVIVVGLAVNEAMVGAVGDAPTVTLAVAGVLPPGPVAVSV